MAKSDKPVDPMPDADRGGKSPVIKRILGTEMSGGERFVRRFLPAVVLSGVLHVAIAGVAALLSFFNPVSLQSAERQDIAIAAEEKNNEPVKEDLSRTDEGPDSLQVTSTDVTVREENTTVEVQVTNMQEPIGSPEAQATVQQDFKAAMGAENPNALTPGSLLDGPGAGAIGDGGLNGVAGVNAAFLGRSAATRNKLVNSYGGSSGSELAVGRGLAWLAKQQKADGSWVYDGSGKNYVAASTGMGLLPFLAAGHTHKAPKAKVQNSYHKNVEAGLAFLLKRQKADGSFSANMYEHAIATVAVCEAYGMTLDKATLKEPTQAAINYIQAAQGANGSWGYRAKSEGDTSIVGWQIQALQSAKLTKDIKVDKLVMEKAMSFLDKVAAGSKKSKYGYTSPSPTPALTAVGLLCRYYANGWGPNHPGFQDGVEYLLASQQPDDTAKKFDMYYFYYATQVMHFQEGDTWHKTWNPQMRDLLIGLQVKEPNKPAVDGSWDPDKGQHIGPICGRLGSTCLILLTLEVYYRHIPLYRRDMGGNAELERTK